MSYQWCPDVVPELVGAGLCLRAFEERDAQAAFLQATDPEVYALTADVPPKSIDEWPASLTRMSQALAEQKAIRWAVTDMASGSLLGTVGFNTLVEPDRRAEIGYSYARSAWGRGVATAAAQLVIGYGFDAMNLRRVEATVMAGNDRSLRVLEKLGFRREGLLRAYKLARGEPKDFWMYGLLDRDWRALQRR